MLVSRDAKFMEDTFDSGRRDRRYNDVVVQDDDEATRPDSHSTTKRIANMKNLRRKKKLSLAASDTK